MGKLTLILAAALVLALVGGCLVLALWNIPVHTTHIEKVLPDARFPK